MLVVTRYRVPAAEAPAFLVRAQEALALLVARPGCLGGRIGRATDDGDLYLLSTEWANVGAYRHALSAFEVKVGAVPLLSLAIDEPTAFEILRAADADRVLDRPSDRAPDADVVSRG